MATGRDSRSSADSGGRKEKRPGPGQPHGRGYVEVQVLEARGLRPVEQAHVVLRPRGRRGSEVLLKYHPQTSTYRATEVDPGPYTLSVEAKGFDPQDREIETSAARTHEVLILGEKGMPFYYRGKVKVPFEPRRDLIAIVLRPQISSRDQEGVASLWKRLGLQLQELPDPIRQANPDLRLLRLPQAADDSRMQRVARDLLGSPLIQWAGPLVAFQERSLAFLTTELIVRFKPHVTPEEIRKVARQHDLEVLRSVSYSPNTFHFAWRQPPSYGLLQVAAEIHRREDVEWAEPNLVSSVELDAINPGDFLWPGVWDRQLVDTPGAWQLLQDNGFEPFGEPSVIIAMVDQGIQSVGGVPAHPEFQGTVSDGSSKVYQLYDFRTLVAHNDNLMGDHGMGTAGVATALANNPAVVPGQIEGLAGAAPNCRVMGLIFPSTEVDQADMYIWAAGFDPNSPRVGFPAPISPGADVFSTSIGFGAGAPISGLAAAMLDFLMTYGRDGKGCLCFFSGGNANNDFTTYRPWAAYEKTWGMAASTLADDGVTEIRAPYSGYGPVELCAPSHDQYPILHNPPTRYGTWSCEPTGTGNLIGHVVTQTVLTAPAAAGDTVITVASVAGFAMGDRVLIDTPGAPGSEPAQVSGAPDPVTNTIPVMALLNAHLAGVAVATGPADYRNNFGGTSSATPLTAGVAALVLSANPDLTWVETRQIMRDTAVRIDAANTDPIGQWLDANGNPSVVSGQPPIYSQWYGYGRVAATAAVQGGLDYLFDRDILVRDNLLDVGTVASAGAFWDSPDIWVRTTDPAVEGAAALPPNYATAGPHQNPVFGQDNWVYARFKNIGTAPSFDFYVRVYITHWPGVEFTYPDSFIPSNRPGDPVPSPMTPGTYLIGETKYTGLAPGGTDIVSALWPSALVPPETVVVGGMTVHWHPCLLAEIAPHDGPAPTGNHIWDDNNLAQKNISIVYVDAGSDFKSGLVIGSEAEDARVLILEIDRRAVPRQVQIFVDLVNPALTRWLRRLIAHRPQWPPRSPVPPRPARGTFLGTALASRELVEVGDAALVQELRGAMGRRPSFALGRHDGRDVLYIADRGRTRIPVPIGGTLAPIIIGGVVRPDAPKGAFRLPIVQRDLTGRIQGGAELVITVR